MTRAKNPWLRLLAASLFLIALVVLAYSDTFQAAWHLDDQLNITENPYLRIASLDWPSLERAMVQDRKHNRPFSNLTFALNYYFNRDRVWGYHLINLALHLLASLAVFALLQLTFRRAGLPRSRRDLAALAAAAAWAVHPIQTQAVTYVVQRQTVMASALMLCTLRAYIAGRESASPARKLWLYGLAGLTFILAAGSKEIALSTPALIFLYELYFFQDLSWAWLRRRGRAWLVVFVMLGAGFALSVQSARFSRIVRGYHNYPFTLGQRLLTEPRVLGDYLGLIVLPLPSRLSLEHDPQLSTSLLAPGTTLLAVLGWMAVLAGAIRYRRRSPLLSFAVLWYLGNIFLESSFLPLDLMFEHRLYLPSLAVIAPLIAGPILAWPRFRWTLVVIGLIISTLLVGTLARNRTWQTELGLWRDCVRKAPAKARSHYGLAGTFLKARQNGPARREYEKALALDPDCPVCWLGLGVAAEREGRDDQAMQYYRTALALQADYVAAINNLGILYSKTGRLAEAEKLFRQALRVDPFDPRAHGNLASALLFQGRYSEAVAEYDRALALDPDFEEVRQNRDYAVQLQQSGAPPPAPGPDRLKN